MIVSSSQTPRRVSPLFTVVVVAAAAAVAAGGGGGGGRGVDASLSRHRTASRVRRTTDEKQRNK